MAWCEERLRMRPTKEQIAAVVQRWAAVRMFPSEPQARAAIAASLSRLVKSLDDLTWLGREVVDNCETWPGMPGVIRMYRSYLLDGATEGDRPLLESPALKQIPPPALPGGSDDTQMPIGVPESVLEAISKAAAKGREVPRTLTVPVVRGPINLCGFSDFELIEMEGLLRGGDMSEDVIASDRLAELIAELLRWRGRG